MNSLDTLVRTAKTIVVVGSGGVGKTTTSAVLALHAARVGRRALVLTIDPARRLANSLGLDTLSHEETAIALELEAPGTLWAMMLDMKRGFDNVVRRNTTPEQTERILDNRFYQSFSSNLSGTQEYSAVERVWELSNEALFDLIVLDTPPTQHALDFLDAPDRVYEALSNSALQWMYRPALASGKLGLGIVKLGARGIRSTLGKLTGSQMLDDTAVFLESLAPVFSGMQERAAGVRDLLRDASTSFLIVTSPDPLTLAEAHYFDDRLAEEGVPFGGFIVNRVHRPVHGSDEALPSVAELTATLRRVRGTAHIAPIELGRIAREMLANTADFDALSVADDGLLTGLSGERGLPVFPIPFYASDIHSIEGLDRVRHDLFDV